MFSPHLQLTLIHPDADKDAGPPLFPHEPSVSPPPLTPSSPELSSSLLLPPKCQAKPKFPHALLTSDTHNKGENPPSPSHIKGPPSPKPPQFSPPLPHNSPQRPLFDPLGCRTFPPALLTEDKPNLPPSTKPTPRCPLFPNPPNFPPPPPAISYHSNARSVLALEPPHLVKDYPLIPDSANCAPTRPHR